MMVPGGGRKVDGKYLVLIELVGFSISFFI